MKLRRHFTTSSGGPYEGYVFRATGPAGAGDDLETRSIRPSLTAPAVWPQPCAEVFAAHALCAEPVPAERRRRREAGVPQALASALEAHVDAPVATECDVRQAIDRVSGALARAGWDRGAFADPDEARTFHDELRGLLAGRYATLAPALWQSLGLAWAYGLPQHGALPGPDEACGIMPSGPAAAAEALAERKRRRANALALACGRAALETGDPGAWPGYLDADSDIWAVIGEEPPLVCALSMQDDPAPVAHAIAHGTGAAAAFGDTITSWSLADESLLCDREDGRSVPASPPPLGAIDLGRFIVHGPDGGSVDLAGLRQAVRVLTIALALAGAGRTVELRLTNAAPVLMAHGLAYGSDEGRALAASIAAFVTASALEASAALAARTGASLPGGPDDRRNGGTGLARVLGNMQRALLGRTGGYDGLAVEPQRLYPFTPAQAHILDAARVRLDAGLAAMARTGVAVVPVTSAAPDAVMDALLGVEAPGLAPMTALVRHRRLAGGVGEDTLYKVLSAAVPSGLRALSHGEGDIERLVDYVTGTGSLADAPGIDHAALRERGFADEDIEAVEAALATSGSLRAAFTPWVLGWDDMLDGSEGGDANDLLAEADMLDRLGFSAWDIEHASLHCCGAMTLEGAPGLPREHLPVFDCAEPLGAIGARAVGAEDRIRMAAAVQPFLTGGISLDLTLPRDTGEQAVAGLLDTARSLGVAALRLRVAGTDLTDPVHGLADPDETVPHEHGEDALGDVAARATVRTVEHDFARDATDACGDTAESDRPWHPLTTHRGAPPDPSDDLAAAIAVGLRHGVPAEAYRTVLHLDGALQRMAETYLSRLEDASRFASAHEAEAAPVSPPHSSPFAPRNAARSVAASTTSAGPATSPPSVSGRSRKVRPGQEGA